jgi:hypothetical protein
MLSLWLVLQLASAPSPPDVPNDPRIERLAAWLTAVQQHAPSIVDAPALVVRWWDREALAAIREDMAAVGSLIRDRNAAIQLSQPFSPNRVGRPRPGYTSNQMTGLRLIAERIRRRAAVTELLKRGALFHTDIALRVPVTPVPMTAGSTAPLERTTLYLDDGRQQGLAQSVDHLEIARQLLDLVRSDPERDDRPDPERDPMVRQWYRATTAVLLNVSNFDLDHFTHALRLFPEDAEILFMAGALRETLAGPRIQDGLRTARLPTGTSYRVDSERDELRRAEGFFRRSLAVDATRVETHLRLGRVLGRLGRSDDAIKELRIALAGAREPRLRYYGELFVGRELDALGERESARGAYVRAAALYPLAQSPRVGVSELAMRAGDRAGAQSAMQAVWRLAAVSQAVEDPLWTYDSAAGRNGERLLNDVSAMFPVGETVTR